MTIAINERISKSNRTLFQGEGKLNLHFINPPTIPISTAYIKRKYNDRCLIISLNETNMYYISSYYVISTTTQLSSAMFPNVLLNAWRTMWCRDNSISRATRLIETATQQFQATYPICYLCLHFGAAITLLAVSHG